MFFPGSLLDPVVQAQLSSIIVDRFIALNIQVFRVSFGWRGGKDQLRQVKDP